jgi:type IV pilus assembly protein PilY1
MKVKKLLAAVQIVCLIFLNCWNFRFARADDSDIFGNNITPNVLIALDTSGSMNDETGTLVAYSSNQSYAQYTYRGSSLVTTTVYRKLTSGSSGSLSCSSSNPCYTVYAASIAAVGSSSARSSLSTAGYWTGSISGSTVNLYYGNYLNYYYCSTCDGIEPKITVAKRVLTNLVNNVDGIRFGVMRFVNNGTPWTGGGGIVAEIGTDKSTIVSAVNAINPSGYTPLGRQMDDVGRYYKGLALRNGLTYSSPIQYSCQPDFVIVISDGLWTDIFPTVDPKQEATNRYSQDHSSTFAGTQNVIVHTIGFSLDPDDSDERTALSDLQTMAGNGGGSFFTANNSAQLEVALQDAITQIMAATFSFATPTVPTTTTSGSQRVYLASFQSNPSRPFWRGYLKAYNRDANGLIPVDAQGAITATLQWDAGQMLSVKGASSRTIKTYANSALQDFTTSNSAVTAAMLLAADNAEKDRIINYIRGATDYNDEDVDTNTAEERPWKLGDIFHSTPVLVTPPFMPSTDSSYAAFKTAQANRTAILLAGANDGMLHAFRESDGEELWAFIPPDLLEDLKKLTALSGSREYYVDSTPVVADVKTGGSWKTIALLGERRGGKYYYALNITNTSSPTYLWSFADSRLGETWSEPAIGKVKMSDGTDKWVAFVGGGFASSHSNYSAGSNMSEAFFAIDLSNGAKLWEYYNASGSSDDRQYMNFSIPAAPAAVDLNNDGYIDKVYIGDVGGQLWKFNVAPAGGTTLSNGLAANWTGKRLFAAASSQTNPPAAGEYYPAQAIYYPPTLTYDTSNNLWVFFGTGDRYHPNNTASNRFYGIKEDTSMTNGAVLTEASLTNLSSGSGTVSQGWYIALATNEKVLAASDVFNSVVFFTTFTPVTAAVCGTGGGDAKLYAVNMTRGDAALNLSTGAVLSQGQAASTAAQAIGTGIPSRPIVILSQSGNSATPYIVAGTTNQQISQTQAPQVVTRRLVGWREVF